MCGVASDIDLWFRLGALWDTVLMQPSLIWWRRHEGQAFSALSAEIDYIKGEFTIVCDALTASECPLGETDRLSAIARMKRNTARRLLRLAVKRKQPLTAFRLIKQMGLSAKDLLAGCMGYR